MTKNQSQQWPLPFVIAHRGASKLAPENTIAALKAAKQAGSEWVECDIQLTKDNQPVIFHDTKLNRTTNGRGKLSDFTLSALQKLDAGSWFSAEFAGEKVPTLQAWLQCALTLKLKLNLELKCETKKESILLAESVIDHLQKYWPAHSNSIFISSSNQFALMQIQERANTLLLGLISEKIFSEKMAANLFQSNIISLHQPFKILNADYVAMLHEQSLHVLAYTVNDLSVLEKLKAIGVDGVFSDNQAFYSQKN